MRARAADVLVSVIEWALFSYYGALCVLMLVPLIAFAALLSLAEWMDSWWDSRSDG